MSQFDKYIKIAQEMINEAAGDTGDMTNNLVSLFKRIENSKVLPETNYITLGFAGEDMLTMLGFASDFSDQDSQSNKIVKNTKTLFKKIESKNLKIEKSKNELSIDNYILTKNLTNVLKKYKDEFKEEKLKELINLSNQQTTAYPKINTSKMTQKEKDKLNKKSNDGLKSAIEKAKPYK